MRRLATLVLACSLLALPAAADHHKPAAPAMNPVGSYLIGVLSILGTAIYMPVKLVWSTVAVVTFGPVNLGIQAIDVNLPKPLIGCMVRGDWQVTPDHLMGEDLRFVACAPFGR